MPQKMMSGNSGETMEEGMPPDMENAQEDSQENQSGYGDQETLGTVPLSFFGDTPPKEGATETVKIVSVDQQSGTVDIVCVRGGQPGAAKTKGAAGLAEEFNS